ncbi:MAG: hypothetical protein H7Y42_11030 [Chitinophagaceae bacterium]|nr:hypothetical protein [Chitinophagaceae bacterium]
MPIPDFQGDTFVAFADISGFKEMMKTQETAVRAIDKFYTAGYRILQEEPTVHGMFISDCAIIFVNAGSTEERLLKILSVIDRLNRQLLQHEIMLTTSISYGDFSYHQRLEFQGIEKNPIFGNAYVTSFLDNEAGQPRIQPGQCRIVKKNLPHVDMTRFLSLEDSGKHWTFYWMTSDPAEIEAFKRMYRDAYQQKYRGMLHAIKTAANNH